MITERTNVGELNKRVTFRERTTSSDGMGGTTDTGSTDILTTWASIKPVSGREFLSQDALQANVTHVIMVRYRDDLVSKGYSKAGYDNVLEANYNGRTFNIHQVRNIEEENDFIRMEAVEEL